MAGYMAHGKQGSALHELHREDGLHERQLGKVTDTDIQIQTLV